MKNDLSGDAPQSVGWYATLHCWDPLEGQIPGAHYWNGREWDDQGSAAIIHWPIVFTSKEEAATYADLHDPDQ